MRREKHIKEMEKGSKECTVLDKVHTLPIKLFFQNVAPFASEMVVSIITTSSMGMICEKLGRCVGSLHRRGERGGDVSGREIHV
jgi:tRNA A-37 threonylcarbamoyl transferase component Bud32